MSTPYGTTLIESFNARLEGFAGLAASLSRQGAMGPTISFLLSNYSFCFSACSFSLGFGQEGI
jgi:hypothetical protein